MPATRTALTDITSAIATPGRRSLCPLIAREDPAMTIRSSYIVPWDPRGHPMETATYAWSCFNCHHFSQQRNDCFAPYPSVDTVYQRSDTDCPGDDMFEDLFMDDLYVFVAELLLGCNSSTKTVSKRTSASAGTVWLWTSMFRRTFGVCWSGVSKRALIARKRSRGPTRPCWRPSLGMPVLLGPHCGMRLKKIEARCVWTLMGFFIV